MDTTVNWHKNYKEKSLSGRYITVEDIAPLLESINEFARVKVIGHSVQKRPIHCIEVGSGTTRILLWSQMHGNESTTTKAIFDLLTYLRTNSFIDGEDILRSMTLCIVPILNPDGAALYTRNNSNDVDLNRDAQDLSQPESIVLKNLFEQIEPDFCFNLHGQRTIYGFEDTGKPSALSFLAPSADQERSITLSRKRAMSIITAISKDLGRCLPGQIGRYDDSFNINCVGDTFQLLGVPTVLFEAGHQGSDYDREESRLHLFLSLLSALKNIVTAQEYGVNDYFLIPEHQKCFCDILIRNTDSKDVAILYQEKLVGKDIKFVPTLANKAVTDATYGHRVVDAQGGSISITFGKNDQKNIDIANISVDNRFTITL